MRWPRDPHAVASGRMVKIVVVRRVRICIMDRYKARRMRDVGRLSKTQGTPWTYMEQQGLCLHTGARVEPVRSTTGHDDFASHRGCREGLLTGLAGMVD